MSKASEWAESVKRRPMWRASDPGPVSRYTIAPVAEVTDEPQFCGHFQIRTHTHTITLYRDDALSLAHWILATYEDAPAPEGSAT